MYNKIVEEHTSAEAIKDYDTLQLNIPQRIKDDMHLTHIDNELKLVYLAIQDPTEYDQEENEETLRGIVSIMKSKCKKEGYSFQLVIPQMTKVFQDISDECEIEIKLVPLTTGTYINQLETIPEGDPITDYYYELIAYHFNVKKYMDLSFAEMEQINKELDFIKAREREDLSWLDKPFVTHANISNKVLYKAFVINDSDKLTGKSSITGMNNICNKHGYHYRVIMNKHSETLEDWCNEVKIDYEIIDENDILKELPPKPKHKEEAQKKEFSLRQYQLDCLKYIEGVSRVGICRLPCGMGKSIIMISYIMTHHKNTLILVPNISLVSQFESKIIEYCEKSSLQLPQIITLSSRHGNQIYPCPTKQQIAICVYNLFVQKVSENMNAFKGFDLFIDEAHHIIHPSKCKKDTSWVESVLHSMLKAEENEVDFMNSLESDIRKSHDFSTVIFNYANIYCNKVFYFSATIDEAGYSVDMMRGIEEGYLCKLNIKIIHTRTKTLPILPTDPREYIIMRDLKGITQKTLNRESILIHYFKHKRYEVGKSIILYCTNCKEAEYLQKSIFIHVPQFTSAVIKASTPDKKRVELFDKFKSKQLRCIITVNCISEGVDLPNADEAIFFVDKRSIIGIIQSVGRILRICMGKGSATLTVFSNNEDENKFIYENIIKCINGEFGYHGNIDLRYAVSNYFLNTYDFEFVETKKMDIANAYYDENQKMWKATNVNVKLNELRMYLDLSGGVLPDVTKNKDLFEFVNNHRKYDDTAWKRIEKMVDEYKHK